MSGVLDAIHFINLVYRFLSFPESLNRWYNYLLQYNMISLYNTVIHAIAFYFTLYHSKFCKHKLRNGGQNCNDKNPMTINENLKHICSLQQFCEIISIYLIKFCATKHNQTERTLTLAWLNHDHLEPTNLSFTAFRIQMFLQRLLFSTMLRRPLQHKE